MLWLMTVSGRTLTWPTVLADAAVDSDDVAYPKRFLLLGMLLFKDILPILAVDHKDSASTLSIKSSRIADDPPVFNQTFILSAFHLLLNKLLPLTSSDLEGLEDEPEEWLIAETNDEEAWAFEFRVSKFWPHPTERPC